MSWHEESDVPALNGPLQEAEPGRPQAAEPPLVDLRRRVQAVADQVPVLRLAVLDVAEAHGASSAAQADIAVAVSEACTNVVVHAYVDAVEQGPLTVEAHHENSEFVVIVIDEGRGMVPRTDSPGLGLGLPLIAQLTKRLEINEHVPGGTTLQMTFAIGVST